MPLTVEDLIALNADVIISHAYDPAKARQYYLRTRQLKGRKTGTAPEPTSNQRSIKSKPMVANKAALKPVSYKNKETEARVAALKVRFSKLRSLLLQHLAEAKKAGAASSNNSNKSETNTKILKAQQDLKQSIERARQNSKAVKQNS